LSSVLLIEDDAASRLVMHNRLRDLGFEVAVAENGAVGLLEARDKVFDLLIVDVALDSGVSGYEVCRRLKQLPGTADVPIVLIARHAATRDEIHKGYEAGCDAFVTKSELPLLEDVLRVLMRGKAKHDELARMNRGLEDRVRRLDEERARAADLELSLQGSGENALIVRELAAGRPDGLLLVDAEGIVRLSDRGARDLLGNNLQGVNLGRLAPASGLEAFVRDARAETREGFRFDVPSSKGRGARSLTASVVPLIANPGEKDPGLRAVLLLDSGKRRVASELLRMQEYAIPRREVGVLLDAARLAFGPASLIGTSAGAQELRRRIADAAQTVQPVLLVGEEGSGKQHAARALHFGSQLSGPFVPLSCAALSPEHLESEIFGQVKGSLPDALVDRPGAMHQAALGTLYLEAVEALPDALQERLLRTIETGEVLRAGAHKPERVDVRVVASTCADLEALAETGAFRRDLLAALRATRIDLLPLRERREDIAVLAQQFARRRTSAQGPYELTDEALWALQANDWPGNVRELETCIDRACAASAGTVGLAELPLALRDKGQLPPHDLHPAPRPQAGAVGTHSPFGAARPATFGARAPWEIGPEDPVSLDLYEKKALLRALSETGGDKLAAARLLKVGKSTLYRKLKRFGIA
jgi:two-component system response regulator HydG